MYDALCGKKESFGCWPKTFIKVIAVIILEPSGIYSLNCLEWVGTSCGGRKYEVCREK